MENESAHSMIFDNNASYVYCENARIQLTGNKLSCISYTGDFINCVANCTSSDELSVCFHVVSSSILKVFGGEYYAYVKMMYQQIRALFLILQTHILESV